MSKPLQGERYRRVKDFGTFREIENYIVAPNLGNHNGRGSKSKASSPAMDKLNDRRAADKVEDKIKANFRKGDRYITLTYWGDTPDMERVRKDVRNFLNKLKRVCDRKGAVLKWLKTIEVGERNGRPHVHLILPQELTSEEIEEAWAKGSVFSRRLWGKGGMNDPSDQLNVRYLAEYFVGATKKGKCREDKQKYSKAWSFSRNCIEPKITYERMSPRWRRIPRVPEGWKLDESSLTEYTDAYGLRHQQYRIVRMNI